jgi:4-amino-4-deoxy-L-arabinose transferase-like glycosyltransferase
MKFREFVEKNQFLILVLIVIFIGAFWRVFEIDVFRGYAPIELNYLRLATETARNSYHIAAVNVPEALYIYALAVLGHFTNYQAVYYRFAQAVLGVATSVFFYLFVKSWFNKQVALISTLFFATNAFLLILSRVINPSAIIIFLQMVILYVLTIAFREKNIYLFGLAGLLAGVGFYVSPFFVLSGLLIMLAGLAVIAKNHKFFVVYKYEFLAMFVAILVAASYYLYKSPVFASNMLAFFNPGSISVFYLNLGSNVTAIFAQTNFRTVLNVGAEPLVDPFIAVSFFCGVIFALFHSNKRKYLFLMLWLLASLVVISLAANQNMGNLVLLMPIIFIFAGSVLDYVLTNWTRTFPYNQMAKLAMTLVFSLFLFLSVYYNFEKFFYGWQENATVKAQFTQDFVIKK